MMIIDENRCCPVILDSGRPCHAFATDDGDAWCAGEGHFVKDSDWETCLGVFCRCANKEGAKHEVVRAAQEILRP